MSTPCPCCGGAMDRPFVVSPELFTISTDQGIAVLPAPRVFPMIELLARKFPGVVRTDALGVHAFGNAYWDLDQNSLRVYISKTRRALEPIGLTVVGKHMAGYRLAAVPKLDRGGGIALCQRCITREIVAAQLEAVHGFSAAHHDQICNGLLDAVANSTIAHAGHRSAAERFFRHADLCVALAPLEPLALPTRAWWTPWAEIAARNAAPVFMAACMLGGFLIGRLQ